MCGKTFGDPTNLRDHERTHMLVIDSSEINPEDGASDEALASAAVVAAATVATDGMLFSCDLCDLSFPNRAVLEGHFRSEEHREREVSEKVAAIIHDVNVMRGIASNGVGGVGGGSNGMESVVSPSCSLDSETGSSAVHMEDDSPF